MTISVLFKVCKIQKFWYYGMLVFSFHHPKSCYFFDWLVFKEIPFFFLLSIDSCSHGDGSFSALVQPAPPRSKENYSPICNQIR